MLASAVVTSPALNVYMRRVLDGPYALTFRRKPSESDGTAQGVERWPDRVRRYPWIRAAPESS